MLLTLLANNNLNTRQPRGTVVQPARLPPQLPTEPVLPPLSLIEGPILNLYDGLPIKRWSQDELLPNVVAYTPIAVVQQTVRSPLYFPKVSLRWVPDIQGLSPLDPSVITSFNYDYPAPKVRGAPPDVIVYNLALLTPTAVIPQPQPLIDYPALARRALAEIQYPNLAIQPLIPQPQFVIDYPKQQLRWPGDDFTFPNIASITFTPPPQPPSTVDAGRHHKRYKVKLGSRTVYFATKAEAVAARERHHDVRILEAKAAGADPKKLKIRRAPIRQVTVDGRHPPDLAPALQIARSHDAHAETLKALKEARMREEEEIAIALLLAQ